MTLLLQQQQIFVRTTASLEYICLDVSFIILCFSPVTQEKGFSSLQGIHGDELPYVFGSPLVDGISPFPSTYNSFEKMMSEAVMTYWTNFAKTG